MASESVPKLALSVEEAAQMFGVSAGLVYVLVRKGELRSVRLGRRILIPRHVVEEMIQPNDAA